MSKFYASSSFFFVALLIGIHESEVLTWGRKGQPMSTNPVLLHPSSSNLHCPVCGGSPQISSSTLTPSFVPADPLLKFNGRTQHESFQAKKKKSNNG